MAAKRKNLPVGFRHLLSKREIKELEREMGIQFFEIAFGNHLDPQLPSDVNATITIHPVSLYGRQSAEGWAFGIHQSGFRHELLSDSIIADIKSSVLTATRQYIEKAAGFIETDFIHRPQLWIYCTINQQKVQVSSRELR